LTNVNDKSDQTIDPTDIAKRRDEIVKRMIATPPQPRPTKPEGSKRGRPPKG
jgi:hypothetical protein